HERGHREGSANFDRNLVRYWGRLQMRYAVVKYPVIGLLHCVFVGSLHCQLQTTPAPEEGTVCELVSKCSQSDATRVAFRAEFISDGLEHSALVDPTKCSQGIQPWTSEAVDDHPDIKALDAALAQGYRGTSDKQIVATFTGRYKCS